MRAPDAFLDHLEHLGALVEAGELTAADAAHRVQQYADGALTLPEARDWLHNWRTVRGRLDRLAAVAYLRAAQTGGEA